MIVLRPDQLRFVANLRAAFRSHQSVLGMAPTGFGKCLGRGTPILMYDGTIVPVEDVMVGDLLMGPDSLPRRVISTTSGIDRLYRVTPTKGDSYVVNEAHILSLRMTSGSHYEPDSIHNVSVADYLTKGKTWKHCAKGWRTGVDFPRHTDPLPVAPYFLGLWLGDGTATKPSITTGDDEIIEYCRGYFASLGMMMRTEQNSENSVNIHGLRKLGDGRGRNNPLLDTMREMGVIGNKHIPHRYKTSSRKDRLALLAGLIDSDGYHTHGVFDIVLKDERLFDDVLFVARSLGFAAYKKQVQKMCCNNGVVGTYFRATISGNTEEIPTIVKRNIAAKRRQRKNVLRVGINVEPIGRGEYFGFEIDGDRLFLLGDFTVTHNTIVSAHIAAEASGKNKRVLFTVHREELLHQTAATFDQFGIRYGYIKSGMVYDRAPLVHIASINTLRNRLDMIDQPDLTVIDEAHLSRAETWHVVIERLRAGRSRILGNSGSPQRLDGKGLCDLFDHMVCGPSTAELIEAGQLSAYRYFRGESPDVGTKKSDYKTEALERVANTKRLVGGIADKWCAIAPDRRTVCFTVSHAHSDSIIAEFASRGVRAESISSKSSKPERKRIIEEFADGAIRVLCNVELITTGFDLAAQVGRDVTVDAVIMARPTQSLALYLQMVGRGLRRKPYPCIILDHAGNSDRHGYPDDPREWSLEGVAKSSAKKLPPPPLDCVRCGCQVRPPAPRVCPHCAQPWMESEESARRTFEYDAAAALVEVSPEEIKAAQRMAAAKRKFEEGSCRTLEDLEKLADARGYKKGWALHRWAARQDRTI